MTDWVYDDNFDPLIDASGWVAVVATACCLLLCLSWAFLPVQQTGRHYLSVCLTASAILLNLGFIIPLAAQPDKCYDTITPNDMHTSPVCAISGACVHFGGWAGVMWLFMRSLSLHLQICWNIPDGRTFMLWAFGVGWGIPVVGGILVFVLNGVSFRFGSTCYTNHKHSMEVFWIPLLIFIGLAVIIALATLGYCLKVYVAVLSDPVRPLPSGASISTFATRVGPRQLYRRVRRVLLLQWRGITVVLIILASIIFYSTVFAFQDNVVRSVTHRPEVAVDWGFCLIEEGGDKNKCLGRIGKHVVSQGTLIAVSILLSFNGVWLFLFLGKWSMVRGWIQLIRGLTSRRSAVSEPNSDLPLSGVSGDVKSYRILSKGSTASY